MTQFLAAYKHFFVPQTAIDILRKVQKRVLDEPRRFDMYQWIGSVRQWQTDGLVWKAREALNPPCGTLACLAGNICIIDAEEKSLSLSGYDIEFEPDEILGFATDPDAKKIHNSIFYLRGWPIYFRERYYSFPINHADLVSNAIVLSDYIDYACQYGIPYWPYDTSADRRA